MPITPDTHSIWWLLLNCLVSVAAVRALLVKAASHMAGQHTHGVTVVEVEQSSACVEDYQWVAPIDVCFGSGAAAFIL